MDPPPPQSEGQSTNETLEKWHMVRLLSCAILHAIISWMGMLVSALFLTWAAGSSSSGLGKFMGFILITLGQLSMLYGRYQALFHFGVSQGVKLVLSHLLAGLSIGTGFSYTRDNPGTHCNAVHILASLWSSLIMAVA